MKHHYKISKNQGFYDFSTATDYELIKSSNDGHISTTKTFYSYGNKFENLQNRAIYTDNGQIDAELIVEECEFLHVTSNDKGGAIFFECLGKLVYHRVCSIDCFSYINCNHIYAKCSKIKETESSFLNYKSGGFLTLYHIATSGLNQCNFSHITAEQLPGFVLQNVDSTQVSIIHYVTLYNLVSESYVFQCQNRKSFGMTSCNIINNKYNNFLFKASDTDVIIRGCSFYSNKANNVQVSKSFVEFDALSKIKMENSFYDDIIAENIEVKNPGNEKFINLFQPLRMGNCKAKYLQEIYDANCAKYDEVSEREQMIKLIFFYMAQSQSK